MARNNPRIDGTLRSVLATLLEEEFGDPRLNFVTITEVESTPDVKHATVYYTTLDPSIVSDAGSADSDRLAPAHEVAAALESAAPRLQSLLAGRVRLRNTPQLKFVPDPVAEQAGKVEALLRKVRAERDQS
ncbi:MAG: 30S ribosome-binding factor RbfA [Nitriliruptorales bacterium]|nr:30S ribosome-binding factor RbfA [Nitriliruptorales bacterium]